MHNYLNELNDAQRRAAIHREGPAMVIAGAGSGKTRVLTYRIAHLIQTGIDPFNILSLTFTNKAAREMKERITKIVGSSEASNIWMGTFHSVFTRILRVEANKVGFPTNFTIYDSDDSKRLIKRIIKELELDDKIYTANAVLGRISSAKSNLLSWEDYANKVELHEEDRATKKPMLGKIFEMYSKRCHASSAMDFDDLLYYTYILLSTSSEDLYKYQNKFKYILVDEYQDTNYAQYLIVRKLAARNENIVVVGDDAQSIYAFRGASIQNILSFQSDYKDCKVYKLEQNYRSTQHIVNAANSVISKNTAQIPKKVWTSNDEGFKIKVIRNMSDNEEAQMVVGTIHQTKMANQLPNTAFAILYRTNAQSRAMEEALRKAGTPYRIYGGLSFYQRKEIKDIISYFRLSINNDDTEALLRILNYPNRKIGKTTEERILAKAKEFDVSAWKIIENINNPKIGIELNSGARAAISGFYNMIKSFGQIIATTNAFEAANYIYAHSGLKMDLQADSTPEGVNRIENIEELFNAIQEFVNSAEEEAPKDLPAFTQDIALLTDADKDKPEDNDKVVLMTIHAAKGLEFPYVFLVGVEENLFPSQMSLMSRSDLEEERRLFYVAITRAEKALVISYAMYRFRYGQTVSSEPSRFISDIDSSHIELINANPYRTPDRPQVKSTWQAKAAAKPQAETTFKMPAKFKSIDKATARPVANDLFTADIMPGMIVEHDKFGRGKVLQIEGVDANCKATVFFDGFGQKQLLMKYAKLKVIQ